MPFMSFDTVMSSSQVQLLKNRFEKLTIQSDVVDSLDITPFRAKNGAPVRFSRSATCIDFSKFRLNEVKKDPVQERKEQAKFQFQRQLSNSSNSSYKSIRRSPAFRIDAQNRPSVVKSVPKEKEDPIKRKLELDEIEYLNTSATIKKALSKPLPIGNPPPKPPRAFQSPNLDKNSSPEPIQSRIHKLKLSQNFPNTLPKKTSKTEDKKGVSSFLNCIISPCSIDPIYYEQIKSERNRHPTTGDETIYMEPFAHLKRDFVSNNNRSPPTTKPSEELHYMCTDLNPPPTDANGNQDDPKDLKPSSLKAPELDDYEKVNIASIIKMFSE